MKLVLLMYLDDDESCVNRLLREQQVAAFNRLPVEGSRARQRRRLDRRDHSPTIRK